MTAAGVVQEEQAIDVGRRKLRHNLLAALATGAGLLGSGLFGWGHWLLGLLIGVLYSNGFEYAYHRILLHSVTGRFSENHRVHHESFGRPDEPLHVNFGGSPLEVVLLIVVNSLSFALLDLLGAGIGAGVVMGFVAYYMTYEALHWQIHLGRLPSWLEWMRRYHFAHHKGVPGRYNVFLPICDALFHSAEGAAQNRLARRQPRA